MGRHRESLVHLHFIFNKSEFHSACKYCEIKLKGNHSTNLKKHLENHHYEIYEKFKFKETEKYINSTRRISKMKAQKQLFNFVVPSINVDISIKTIIDACVDLVTVNGRPFSMLNDTGFRKILDPVLNGFKKKVTINSYSIKKHVHEECLLIKKKIANKVHLKLISLKLDAVTRLNRAFLGINMQYIENDSIKLRTLGLIELTKSHSGIYLKETILSILKKFKIDPKQLYTITSDNGANMIKGISFVEEILTLESNDESNTEDNATQNETIGIDLDSSDYDTYNSETGTDCTILDDNQIEMVLNEDVENIDTTYEHTERILNEIEFQNFGDSSIFTGIRCVAHTLQLPIIDSLKDNSIEALLSKVRTLVRKLRNQTYMYLIKKEKLKYPILDCLTRWNSTFDMIERLKYLKGFIQNMAANDCNLRKISLNFSEWQQVDMVSKTLLPAKICSKKLQSEQLTLTDFYGAWISCKIETKSLKNSFSDKLVKRLETREKHIMNNKVLLAAIFLDPRFKVTLNEAQCNIAINHLITIWLYIKEIEMSTRNLTNDITEVKSDDSSSSKDSDVLESFLKQKEVVNNLDQLCSTSSQNSISTKIETLLKTYHLDQKRLSHKMSILQFWKSMKSIYPEIYVLAKVVFAVPSTQVSVERLFSGLKFILSPYRSNATSKTLEDQLLVRTNRLFEKEIVLMDHSKEDEHH